MKIILSLFFAFTTCIGHSQNNSIKKEKWHWDNPSSQDTSAGYVQVIKNVVKENLYTTDTEAMKKYNSIRKTFYNEDFPAATWVQIARLYMSEAKLEVELTAHLPNKSGTQIRESKIQ